MKYADKLQRAGYSPAMLQAVAAMKADIELDLFEIGYCGVKEADAFALFAVAAMLVRTHAPQWKEVGA